jgi:hypothetical protein
MKAWIENDTVRDICPGNPAECYHPDIAVHYNTDVPDGTINGATLVDGEWVNPVIPEPTPVEPVQPDITVSPVEFMLLFTSPERIFIKSIRQSDPVVSDFMDIIEHPKLTLVNLSLASTQQAVDYLLSKLVEATVITAEDAPVRRESILSGAFQ